MSHDDNVEFLHKRAELMDDLRKLKGDNAPKQADAGTAFHVTGERATVNHANEQHIHYYSENMNIDKMLKCDDSAKQQGREAVRERKQGEKIEPCYMTPKEYRNYKAGLWDGVERKKYRYNWTEFEWERLEATTEPVRFVDKKPQKLERRQLERRVKPKRVEFEERRNEQRRKQDQLDHLTYYGCLLFSFFVLLTLTVGVIVTNVNFEG